MKSFLIIWVVILSLGGQFSSILIFQYIWYLAPITTDVVGSTPAQGEVYNIMWWSLSVTCGRSVVFSWSSGDLHQ